MAWYNNDWSYAQEVTVDHTKASADQTDYPVYLNLALMSAGFFDNVQNGGGDIRITEADGVTEIAREIVSCDTSGETGEVHFLAPTLSAETDTSFWVYYGNPDASDYAPTATYGRNAVWTAYIAVWHMETTVDSTGNGHDITLATGNSYATGIMGNGITTVNSDHNGIGFSEYSWAANTGFSLEIWAYKTADSTTGQFTFIGDGSSSNTTLVNTRNADKGVEFQLGGNLIISNYGSVPVWGLNSWLYVSATADTTQYSTNWNGVQYYDDVEANTFSAFNSNVLAKGNYNAVADATYDEARIQDIFRSNDYFVTNYNNQSSPSTFYSIGSQQSHGSTPDVADSITTSESVTLTISQTNLSISVADSISTDESITVSMLFEISVNDSVSIFDILFYYGDLVVISESISILISAGGISVSASDSITTSESVTISVSNPQINTFDSSTISEYDYLSIGVQIAATDSIEISENATLFIGTALTVEDSVSISEFVSPVFSNPQINVTDSVSVSEETIFYESEGINVEDSINVSETVSAFIGTEFNLNDSTTISEFVAFTFSNPQVNVSDSSSISEFLLLNIGENASGSDSVSLSESVTLSINVSVSVSENISISENTTIYLFYFVETINVNDSISASESATVTSETFVYIDLSADDALAGAAGWVWGARIIG